MRVIQRTAALSCPSQELASVASVTSAASVSANADGSPGCQQDQSHGDYPVGNSPFGVAMS